MIKTSKITTLKKRSEFLVVAGNKRDIAAKGVILQTFPRNDGNPAIRVGYTATRKVGGAVQRNRIKRRLRAAVQEVFTRDNTPAQPGWDYVLIGRKSTLDRPYDGLVKDLLYCLHQTKDAACS